MRRHIKGQSITIEALVVGMASLVIVALAMRYITSFMVSPAIVQGMLEGRLCGRVLLVSNVGRTQITVDSALAVMVNGSTVTITHLFSPPTLRPGDTVKVILPMTAEAELVTITGRDFPTVVIKNECKG